MANATANLPFLLCVLLLFLAVWLADFHLVGKQAHNKSVDSWSIPDHQES